MRCGQHIYLSELKFLLTNKMAQTDFKNNTPTPNSNLHHLKFTLVWFKRLRLIIKTRNVFI